MRFVLFVRVKSFRKKKKRFETAMMTSSTLLLTYRCVTNVRLWIARFLPMKSSSKSFKNVFCFSWFSLASCSKIAKSWCFLTQKLIQWKCLLQWIHSFSHNFKNHFMIRANSWCQWNTCFWGKKKKRKNSTLKWQLESLLPRDKCMKERHWSRFSYETIYLVGTEAVVPMYSVKKVFLKTSQYS